MSNRRTQTMDGNTAAAYISYPFTEVAAIFPITPSSPMAELTDAWAAQGKKNLFGAPVRVVEMQSEGGAAGALHGSLQGGALTTTYTASQGLLLMIPNMYKIAGELLPAVFHVSARSLASNSLSIFGDHQDVMATRQTGFAMLASSSVQDVMNLGAVAHLSAIEARLPFIHFFDGFRTSHEIQKIELLEQEELADMLDWEAVEAFRHRALNPDHPQLRGMTHNPDVFFQLREAVNPFVDALPGIVRKYMDKINAITGKDYKFFNYYGHPEADRLIVVMGSGASVVEETIDELMRRGEKVGMVNVRLYRPFLPEKLLEAVPASVKRIAVLDRTKEPGACDPLCLDVRNAYASKADAPAIYAGRYGLASKDFTPAQVLAVFDNLAVEQPRDNFTVGIIDDVTHTSLEVKDFHVVAEGQTACKFWGFGSDGTVGANKLAVKIIGDHTDLYSQAYFAYDSRKSGGVTISHLRFGSRPIRSSYLIDYADFIACHNQSYVDKYDLLRGIKEGGTFLLNCMWNDGDLEKHLPASLRRTIARKKIRFYTLNAVDIAMGLGLGGRINMLMQAAFFKLAGIIPLDDAVAYLNEAIVKTYGRKGHAVVDMNQEAVRQGIAMLHEVAVPAAWADAEEDAPAACDERPDFVRNIVDVMNRQEGDELPVSAFLGYEDGTWPVGITAFEKRGAAIMVPVWDAEKCVQCNKCAFACPHAAIRPVLLTEEEKKSVPAGFETVPAKGLGKDSPYFFRMQVSPYDCLGCGVCLTACPAEGALTMTSFEDMKPEQTLFDEVAMNESYLKKDVINDKSVKNVQFAKPYFQFSAACAGCAETTYIKLLSQLFGDRMYIGNAAGCSSAISGGAPILPYCKDCQGHGPAWEHSLFEDNAEFAYGFFHAQDSIRKELLIRLEAIKAAGIAVEAVEAYENGWKKTETSRTVTDALIAALEQAEQTEDVKYVLENKEYLAKKSVWAVGGDGWAYDIGYGGIDHVMAQNRDVNLMVLDTEVYSNTGGQSSKSTPTSATAKFAAGGKRVAKKDLGAMLMQYGYVYVAQVAMGADQAQTLKALREAESYDGPSIVICYCPCLEQHIKAGMGTSQDEMKKAVECGYWHLYRYDPRRIAEGKNPFQLDSKEPDTSKVMDFLMGENRFASLKNNFPDKADALYAKEVEDVKARYAKYKKLAEG